MKNLVLFPLAIALFIGSLVATQTLVAEKPIHTNQGQDGQVGDNQTRQKNASSQMDNDMRAALMELVTLIEGGKSAGATASDGNAAKPLVAAIEQVQDRLPQNSFRRTRLNNIAEQLTSGGDLANAKQQLRLISDDMLFKPKFEADQPVGFPEPTPVGEIEVKSYPKYRMARTESSGEDNNAFFTLFRHIQANDIAMTAPVEMTYTSTNSDVEEKSMAFLYANPEIGTAEELDAMEVVDVAPLKVVSIGLRGDVTPERIEEARRTLKNAAQKMLPEKSVGEEIRVLGYNSPGVAVNDRYSEVQLIIDNQ